MDFHAAMETFAEAWVAANTPTAVNSTPDHNQSGKPNAEDLPTLLNKDQIKQRGSVSPKTPSSTSSPQTHPPSNTDTPPLSSPSSTGKSLPIHCIIEQTSGPVTFDSSDCESGTSVELDSYAILPSSTLFTELVRSALVKLGYNSTESMNAKGAIQIKNWKPLTFDLITSNNKATLEDILGELTQTATLRIRLCSQLKMSSTDEVKSKLLQLLLTQSHGLLLSSGCPIEKNHAVMPFGTPRLIRINFPGFAEPSQWTDQAVRCCVFSLLKDLSQSTLAKLCPLTQSTISNIANWKYTNKLSSEKCKEFGDWYKKYMASSTEFPEGPQPKDSRQTFHPQHEVPLMREWFKTCKNPSDAKLNYFAQELNKGHVRQERPKVTTSKIKMWWKNERQREKRHTQSVTSDTKLAGMNEHDKTESHDLLRKSQRKKKSHDLAKSETSNVESNKTVMFNNSLSSTVSRSPSSMSSDLEDDGILSHHTEKHRTPSSDSPVQSSSISPETSTSLFKSPYSLDKFLF